MVLKGRQSDLEITHGRWLSDRRGATKKAVTGDSAALQSLLMPDHPNLDPAGPILGRLGSLKRSTDLVELANGAGIVFDLALSERDNYSHSTRIRTYLVRIRASLAQLSSAPRLASLSAMARGLMTRGLVDETALALELEA